MTNISFTKLKLEEFFPINYNKNNATLLTLFTWMGLLSSTGSTAAALTLNRTPMRAANTTRSCMLWQEYRWLTKESHRECVREWVSACVRVRFRKGARDPVAEWWRKCSAVGGSWSQDLKAVMSLLLYLQSPSLFYMPLPPVCHWRTGWWVYDEGFVEGVCVCVCVRERGRGGEMKGSGHNKWNHWTVNLFDKLHAGCIHVIHGGNNYSGQLRHRAKTRFWHQHVTNVLAVMIHNPKQDLLRQVDGQFCSSSTVWYHLMDSKHF